MTNPHRRRWITLLGGLLFAAITGSDARAEVPADDAVLAGPLEVNGEAVAGLRVVLATRNADRVAVEWAGAPRVGFAEQPTAELTLQAALFSPTAAVLLLDFGDDPLRPLVIRGDIHPEVDDTGVWATRFTVQSPAVDDAEALRRYLVDEDIVPVDTAYRCREPGGADWTLTFPFDPTVETTLMAPDGTVRPYRSTSSRRSDTFVGGESQGTVALGLVFGDEDALRMDVIVEYEGDPAGAPELGGYLSVSLARAMAAGARVELHPIDVDPDHAGPRVMRPAPPAATCTLSQVQAGFAARTPPP